MTNPNFTARLNGPAAEFGAEAWNACANPAGRSDPHPFTRYEFFAALDPEFADVVDSKMSRSIARLGECAGRLSERAAAWTGLPAGIAVAVANVDAHVSAPATSVTVQCTMVVAIVIQP